MLRDGVQFNPNDLQAGQGSGLGMWIAKEIISLHHGILRVSSQGHGSGSTFEIILPVYLRVENGPHGTSIPSREDPTPEPIIDPHLISTLQEPTSPRQEPSPPPKVDSPHKTNPTESIPSSKPTVALEKTPNEVSAEVLVTPLHTPPPEPPPPPSPRVLVVDDSPSCRKIVSRLLRSKGFICSEAENGEVCVNMILSGDDHYDLIVLDYEMPVMNGPTAAQKLREMKCDILIVGLTGNVLPEDKEYFLKHGANLVLFKPLNFTELISFYQQHCSSPGVMV
jgi:CheY-like chemotaxis protein